MQPERAGAARTTITVEESQRGIIANTPLQITTRPHTNSAPCYADADLCLWLMTPAAKHLSRAAASVVASPISRRIERPFGVTRDARPSKVQPRVRCVLSDGL